MNSIQCEVEYLESKQISNNIRGKKNIKNIAGRNRFLSEDTSNNKLSPMFEIVNFSKLTIKNNYFNPSKSQLSS